MNLNKLSNQELKEKIVRQRNANARHIKHIKILQKENFDLSIQNDDLVIHSNKTKTHYIKEINRLQKLITPPEIKGNK